MTEHLPASHAAATPPPAAYSAAEIAALWRAIRERRDMRHFLPHTQLPEGCLERLISAAHLAPSVGYMQPWRFIRIQSQELRQALHAQVEAERLATAAALPSRNEEFRKVKIEGIRDCAELLVAVLMPGREKHLIGRRTLPEMDIASLGCAIQNMWLAARAEAIGLGWVSFFDAEQLGRLLELPAGAKAMAILCIGPVAQFYPRPMFEQAGWGQRLDLDAILFEDRWPQNPPLGGTTPTPY
jgi:5,6-dimethylbenzimidazole synthase